MTRHDLPITSMGRTDGLTLADSRQIFARNLSYWMDKRGLSRPELARRVGKKTPVISQWLNEVSGPDLLTIGKLAEILQVPTHFLLYDHDAPEIEAPAPREHPDERLIRTFAARLGKKVRFVDAKKNP